MSSLSGSDVGPRTGYDTATDEPSAGPGDDPAVRVRDLHITYRTVLDPKVRTLRHRLTRLGRRDREVREVRALRGVNFEVPHGKVLGIVGANGAGKSTLMRAVAGILPPTAGSIEVNGRISTLLALGVGFNGNLSGRENVVLGGLAAGLSRRGIAERYQQIADWAELGDFMDMPMRTYSSGMYGRLAFAVSTHMDPEVLLIDEALSAGDAKFKQKSYDKISELVAQARSILLVSHGVATLRDLCTEVIWVHSGRVLMRGDPVEVTAAYLKYQEAGEVPVVMEDV